MSEQVESDPYQSEEYARFVASMVPHCHCCERNRPCDGVLAGGICDGVTEPEREETGEYDDE